MSPTAKKPKKKCQVATELCSNEGVMPVEIFAGKKKFEEVLQCCLVCRVMLTRQGAKVKNAVVKGKGA